jgi:hypothetical protein
MTELLTGDAKQIKKLTITAVKAELACAGPMFFEIVWLCDHCRTRNSFQKRYSLLPPQTEVCTNCGTNYQYAYPHEYFKRLYDKRNRLTAFEEMLFRKVYGAGNASWTSLGKNLFFVIAAQVLSGQNEA